MAGLKNEIVLGYCNELETSIKLEQKTHMTIKIGQGDTSFIHLHNDNDHACAMLTKAMVYQLRDTLDKMLRAYP